MPKINVNKLKKNDIIVWGDKEYKVTSLSWDNVNERLTILGTNGFAESVRENTKINIK